MSERTFPDESTPRIGKSQTESGLIKNTHSYLKKDVLFPHPGLALRERKKYENTP